MPAEIVSCIDRNYNNYKKSRGGGLSTNTNNYWWSDSNNLQINDWCQRNICPDVYFAFQAVEHDLNLHKDNMTKVKLTYVLDCGGENVITEFWDDTQDTCLASYKIEPMRWHIFNASTVHRVIGMAPGRTRFAITGRVFQ